MTERGQTKEVGSARAQNFRICVRRTTDFVVAESKEGTNEPREGEGERSALRFLLPSLPHLSSTRRSQMSIRRQKRY